MRPTVVVTPRGEERVRSGHPWIYRADVAAVRAEAGDVVLVQGARRRAVGLALYSSQSQIAVRMLSREDSGDAAAVEALVRQRIAAAAEFRRSLEIDATACRVVHGEADLLPS